MPDASISWREIAASPVKIVGVAAAYIATGKLGLKFDPVAGFATLVWAPSGISLAALLLLGRRVWPGITIGAFVVNVWAGAPIPVGVGIALGNTIGPLLGAHALRRIPGFRESLERVTDVMGLIVLAAGLSTLVSAALGVFALMLTGLVSVAQFGAIWGAWWLGDAIGDLTVAPLILTWATGKRICLTRARCAEGVALLVVVAVLTLLVFASAPPPAGDQFWRTYMISTPLVWAALRFETRGAATTIALVTAIAVARTAGGTGAFAAGPLHQDLFFLQIFIAILAVTFLTLSAVVAERAYEHEARALAERAEHEAIVADQAKSDFVAVMSHELRTPLTAIIGYADLLREEVTGPLSDKQKAQLERVHVAGDHLTNLIDQILMFSRLESGRERVHMERVDVIELVREVAAIAEPLVRAKGLRFAVEYPPVIEPLVTDSGKLRQILLNLISNAVKFTDHGEVRFICQLTDDRIMLAVRDTGIGIETANLEIVFEPFWQVEQGLDRNVGGTGLGLNVSRRLARAIGGELDVQSTLGEGSTFAFTCPRDSGAGAGPRPVRRGPDLRPRGEM